jgi:hypothetical protein
MNIEMRGRRIALTVLVLFVAAGTWIGARPAEAEADPLLDLPFTSGGCTYHCRECGFEKHDIVVAVTSNATSSHLETCGPGTCDGHKCKTTLVDAGGVGEVWFDVREADGRELREILRRHSDVAFYNEQRDAVQIRGCDGNVMASIPLSAEQVALLEE